LLLTEEDLHPESLGIKAEIAGIAVLPSATVSAPESPAAFFSKAALQDAAQRTAAHFNAPAEIIDAAALAAWAKALGVRQLVTGAVPVGQIAWQLRDLSPVLAEQGVALVQLQRNWDRKLWPLATAGFFKLKIKLPDIAMEYASDQPSPQSLQISLPLGLS
jgi:deoxyribodipyrimidine photo-lyase